MIFRPTADRNFRSFVNALQCFGIGVSWGGYESLVLPMTSDRSRKLGEGPLLRFSIGFDDLETLKTDLRQAFNLLQD